MSALSNLPAARRWPAQHPDPSQLYALPPPNRVSAFIMSGMRPMFGQAGFFSEFGEKDHDDTRALQRREARGLAEQEETCAGLVRAGLGAARGERGLAIPKRPQACAAGIA